MTKEEFDKLTIEDMVSDDQTSFSIKEIWRDEGVIMAEDGGTHDYEGLTVTQWNSQDIYTLTEAREALGKILGLAYLGHDIKAEHEMLIVSKFLDQTVKPIEDQERIDQITQLYKATDMARRELHDQLCAARSELQNSERRKEELLIKNHELSAAIGKRDSENYKLECALLALRHIDEKALGLTSREKSFGEYLLIDVEFMDDLQKIVSYARKRTVMVDDINVGDVGERLAHIRRRQA